MINLGTVNENKVLDVTVGGKLTRDDYARATPRLEALLDEHGRLRFLIEIRDDFEGAEIGALWDDLRFDVKHGRRFDRTAVVGHGTMEKWATKISNLFFDAEMRFFERDEKAEAERWVNA